MCLGRFEGCVAQHDICLTTGKHTNHATQQLHYYFTHATATARRTIAKHIQFTIRSASAIWGQNEMQVAC